jgi:hypothetical protein
MKRLLAAVGLAAVGLAAVVCLALVLAACTDGVSSPEENPLSDRGDTVSGTVTYEGNPVKDAHIGIYYWAGAVGWQDCYAEKVWSEEDGSYEIEYESLAKDHPGYADAEKGALYGKSDVFWYPAAGGEVTGIDIEME